MIQIEQRGKNLVKLEDFKLCSYSYNIPYLSDWIINYYSGGQQINVQNNIFTFMVKRPDLITPYIALNVQAGKSYTISLQNLTSNAIYIRYGLYPTIDAANSIANAIEHIYVLINSLYTITPQHNGIALIGIGLNYVSSPLLLQFKNFQLEEGSVATPYEDPWVNTLTFDEALMSGEKIEQDGNKFYLINNWHRTNKDPYETVTFSSGTATLGESSKTNSSIVVDIDTGEVKNSLNSGTTVQVYLNQYDSWTTDNATTTAFNLTKVSLTNDYPVAINGNVTTSGFTRSTTQIVFANPIASGSSVSCVYPYLDTGYNSQAKVFYKKTSTSRDEVTYTGFPFELTDGTNHIAIQDQLPAQLDIEDDDVDTAQSISFPTDLTVNEEDVLKETDTKDHRRNSLRLTRKVTGSMARLQDSTFLEDFKDVQFRVHYHNISTDGVLLDEYLLHAEFTKNSSNLLAKDLTDSRDFVAEKKVIKHA